MYALALVLPSVPRSRPRRSGEARYRTSRSRLEGATASRTVAAISIGAGATLEGDERVSTNG